MLPPNLARALAKGTVMSCFILCVPECPILGQLYCVLIEVDFEKQKLLKVFVVK